MKTKIKGRFGSIYYFGYEDPFLFEPGSDRENSEETEPPPVEEPGKDAQEENNTK